MRDWKNRHVSRVTKPADAAWVEYRPVCPLCGFECLSALQPEDYLYILQDHYTVCIGVGMGHTPSDPRNRGWHFGARSPLHFKWNPEEGFHSVWAYMPHEDGSLVLIHGFSVFTDQTHDDARIPTYEDAQEASRRYVRAWDSAATKLETNSTDMRIRYTVGMLLRGEWVPSRPACWPDKYYIFKRGETSIDKDTIAILTGLLSDEVWARQAWEEYREGRNQQQILQDVAMAFASGTLTPLRVPDNADSSMSSDSNGSGIVASEVLDLFDA